MRRQAKAAHIKYNDLPTETTIPMGVGFAMLIIAMLISWAFLIITVHIAALIKTRRLLRADRIAEKRKV